MPSKMTVMRATMTRLIKRIWKDYYADYLTEDSKEGEHSKPKENEEFEEQEENEEEDKCSKTYEEIKWQGRSTGVTNSGEALYGSAVVCGDVIRVGGAVMIETSESIFLVEYMFEKLNGEKMVHGRLLQKGSSTMLGNAANERELFLTDQCMEFELRNVKEPVLVDVKLMSWGPGHRRKQGDAYMVDSLRAEKRKMEGLAMEFYCKCLYNPKTGAFVNLPYSKLGLGTGYCSSCRKRETKNEDYFQIDSCKTTFMYKNIRYRIGDYFYVRPQCFNDVKEENGTRKGGRNVQLKAYVVCQLVEIKAPKNSANPTPGSTEVMVRRFYRPEDISAAKAYSSDIREVYYSKDIFCVLVEMIKGKCEVKYTKNLPNLDFPMIFDHILFSRYSYDPTEGEIYQLPCNVKPISHTSMAADNFLTNKALSKCRLVTLDIFAGCGGLSEGFQQSGVSITKWAIEYEQTAGEAFRNNHPEAQLFIDNCSVILRAIMEKGGDADDCISTPEAVELARTLDKEKHNNLPMPGQVDLIIGGPPCQGFSKLNGFTQGTWSMVQSEMILAYLSFADYFRPRFLLLENVRNFVSFDKGQMFRLTIASLLEMGYQVRFGILQAGAYGVPQSRKRVFIWAGSPAETLPKWPEPMHVFASPELKISLSGGLQYAAVKSTAAGAPFRSLTVRDAIRDLPPVRNGASKLTIDYESNPTSWYQKQFRGNMRALNDHISKELNELNLIRCKRIPKSPGANWRNLPNKKVKLSNGRMANLIPPFLPNTAERCNQWKGVLARLDWEGTFLTVITNPQPTGKVGKCFHPEQDRIITVRECARSQGFLDSYCFSGNIQDKHRQIGNAVPPPLAYALGRQLREVLNCNSLT